MARRAPEIARAFVAALRLNPPPPPELLRVLVAAQGRRGLCAVSPVTCRDTGVGAFIGVSSPVTSSVDTFTRRVAFSEGGRAAPSRGRRPSPPEAPFSEKPKHLADELTEFGPPSIPGHEPRSRPAAASSSQRGGHRRGGRGGQRTPCGQARARRPHRRTVRRAEGHRAREDDLEGSAHHRRHGRSSHRRERRGAPRDFFAGPSEGSARVPTKRISAARDHALARPRRRRRPATATSAADARRRVSLPRLILIRMPPRARCARSPRDVQERRRSARERARVSARDGQ